MTRAPDTFQTARMRARRVNDDDLEYIARVDTDPVMQATLLGRLSTREESAARLTRWLAEERATGLGFWIFFDDAGDALGHGGLFASAREPGFVELGYAILPNHWGHGYATEMSMELLAIAHRLSIEGLIGLTRATNQASRRVLEKTGFVHDRDLYIGDIFYARYVDGSKSAT